MKRVQSKGSQSITSDTEENSDIYNIGKSGYREALELLKEYNKKKGNFKKW